MVGTLWELTLYLFTNPGDNRGQLSVDPGIAELLRLEMFLGDNDDIHIHIESMLVQAEKFLENPFNPVSFDSLADLFADGCTYPQSMRLLPLRVDKNNETSGKVALSVSITGEKIPPLLEPALSGI